MGSASNPLSERHGWTAEEVRSHWNWALGSGLLEQFPGGLHGTRLSLLGLNFRAGLADMSDCARCGSGLEETAEHAFYYCERVPPYWDHVGEWTACIETQTARAARYLLRRGTTFCLRCRMRSVWCFSRS